MADRLLEPRLLFVDAYDSFSENIGALLTQTLQAHVTFTRIDRGFNEDPALFATYLDSYDAIVLGPGPGNPTEASDIGMIPSIWVVAKAHKIPVLGICLGFQSLCHTFGAPVVHMPFPCHGLTKNICHTNTDIFEGTGEFVATSYNSLAVKLLDLSEPSSEELSSRPDSGYSTRSNSMDISREIQPKKKLCDLVPLAWDVSGWLMAVRHKNLPLWGLQFHPESCMSSPACRQVIRNWWDHASKHNTTQRRGHLKTLLSWAETINVQTAMSRARGRPFRTNAIITVDPSMTSPPDGLDDGTWRLGILQEMLPQMRQCAASSGRIVQSMSTGLKSQSLVADICYELSSKSTQKSDPSWTGMLESTRKGRYSIYAVPGPTNWRLEVFPGRLVLFSGLLRPTVYKIDEVNVFEVLLTILQARKASGGDPNIPFWGGFLGFFSYEMGLQTAEFVTKTRPHLNGIPDVSLVWVERSIVVDHLEGRAHIQSIRQDDSEWIGLIHTRLSSAGSNRVPYSPEYRIEQVDVSSSVAQIKLPDEAAYKANIIACQQELQAGNSYELCLTVEAEVQASTDVSGWSFYQNLKRCNPVPFAAYLKVGKTTVLSSSPEQFLFWDRQGTVDMIPMKGTVKKSPDMTLARASEILASPKESAENLMIADLIRHDLYRAFGSNASVEVVKLCEVIEHETVYQLVSHIRTNPSADLEAAASIARQTKVIERGLKVLSTTLPPGSMTGAPKKRSCEILSNLEQRNRGVYSGVLGYMDVGGGGNFSVCIRTAFANEDENKDGLRTWRIGAGGAITVLSDVDAEWEEMRTKMESVLCAFQ